MAKSGNIWGNIWISVGDQHFPEFGWNDMPVALLAELVLITPRLREPESRRVQFFDGPFWVDLQTADGSLSITGGRSSQVLLQAANVDFEAFVGGLVTKATQVVEACESRGWGEQQDVQRLARLIK